MCGQRALPGVPASRASPDGLPLVCRNGWCSVPGRAVEAVFWANTYEGALRKAVLSYKYHADLRWARVFAHMLYRFLTAHATWFEEFAVLCPVPSYQGRGARRWWGHVELLCAELASLAGAEWPVEHLVRKVRETAPMSARSYPDRRQIAVGSLTTAFVVSPGAVVEGQSVLVVDDVCASGETLLAVGGALRRAGAREVAGLVVARAPWRSVAPMTGCGS
jgi:predicted amidophosphoribosyltransferase